MPPTTTTTRVYLPGNDKKTIDELKFFLRCCSLPLFDPWTNVIDLHLRKMTITHELLPLLVEFLNLPLAKDPTGKSDDEERRWIDMTIQETNFSNEDVRGSARNLLAALVDRTLRLNFTESHALLSYFLDTPEIECLRVEEFSIEQEESLSPQQYAILGNVIARTVQLKEFHTFLPLADGANALFHGIANAITLQKLNLKDGYLPETTHAELLIGGSTTPSIHFLQNPKNQLKKLSLEESQWNKVVVHLHLDELSITDDLMPLLVEFLNLPLAEDPNGRSDEERRWIAVTIDYTNFENENVRGGAHDLCRAIADRALRLDFTESHQSLSHFLDTPDIEHLWVEELSIKQQEEEHSLSAQQYARLGNLIARTVQLKELYLSLPLRDGAHAVFDGIANAVTLQELTLEDGQLPQNAQVELLIGGNCPLIQLLQNPQNQLKKLSVESLGLNDQQLIAILQLLPTCQIEVFHFGNNLIASDGILEFTRQLPRIHSLKHVRFGFNPWEESETARNATDAALLQYVMENTTIESMDLYGLEAIPQGRLIWYYLILNRAGRRLLASSSQPIPDGLWPLVLQRAGDFKTYCRGEMGHDWRFDEKKTARHNAVFFFARWS